MNDKRPEEEFNNQLSTWNTNIPFSAHTPIHYFIAENGKKYADKTAVSYHDIQITYQELNERSNQIAFHLISQGIKPGDKIALALDRSHELVICLIALMKTGAAYIPVDPSYPKLRIEHMLADSMAKFVLTSNSYKN